MNSSVLLLFIRWYFFDAPKGILIAWRNFLLWAANTFSLGLMTRTLFSPWRRTVFMYKKGNGLNVGYLVDSIIFTNFSRVVGFLVRSVMIITGVVWLLLVFIFGFFMFLGWFLIPFVFAFFFISIFG